MTKTTIWTAILSLALTTAAFAATDEEKCQKKKLIALGKRDLCIAKEAAKEVLGKTPDVAKCAEKFDKQITKADEAAAKKGASCRWLENGDGTATDLNSGLQWELKTDDGSIHDKDDLYFWSATGTDPDGEAFVAFLGTLNRGNKFVPPYMTTGCFAGKCDWRLPTIEELVGIVDLSAPGCGGGSPCTTIPGETALGPFSIHYSSSDNTNDAGHALSVNFDAGGEFSSVKDVNSHFARAVRGGS